MNQEFVTSLQKLEKFFIINTHTEPKYINRLNKEIEIFEKLDLINYLIRVIEIFNQSIKQHKYLLRGSSASSLLLYYVGINEIDPIKFNIPISRFINILRNNLPDIDIDVPQSLKENIINQILKLNNDTVRISSNFEYENNENLENLIKEDPISNVHNSAIVIYSENQKQIISTYKITENQLILTKDNIQNFNLKKIDILSNTGLDQLNMIESELNNTSLYNFDDIDIFNFICNDDGIGITFAETPNIQYVIKLLKPKSIIQLSICLAIIRPFACTYINKHLNWNNLENKIIFDDDCIIQLQNILNISEDESDQIRRLFKKNNDRLKMDQILTLINNTNNTNNTNNIINIEQLIRSLNRMSKYGFCKSHAISYAKLIFKLYYHKLKNPKIFWKSTIKSIKGYYNDWVYIRKSLLYDIKFRGIKDCNSFTHFINTGYWLNDEFLTKCYLKITDNNNKNIDFEEKIIINKLNDVLDNIVNDTSNEILNDPENEIKKEYYEGITNNEIDLDNYYLLESINNKKHEPQILEKNFINKECEFRGIIAGTSFIFTKYKKHQTVITIGYSNNKFINLYLNKIRNFKKFKQVIGKGYYIDDECPHIIITKLNIF